MIGYDHTTTADAQMYFGGCIAWHYVKKLDRVVPFTIPTRLDTDVRMFRDARFRLHTVRKDLFDYKYGSKMVTGATLTESPDYIIHRIPIEYVPVNNGQYLTRVTLERRSRRALKGSVMSNAVGRPILTSLEHVEAVDTTERAAHITMHNGGMGNPYTTRAREALIAGVAEVLTIGTPDCMARVISREDASDRARDVVRQVLLGERKVAVPDFSTAVVAHRTKKHLSYVLHQGVYIGEVMLHEKKLVYIPDVSNISSPVVRRAVVGGQKVLAERLFADATMMERPAS